MAKKAESQKKKKQNKKKLLSAQNAKASKTKPVAENPFEIIWSRRKFDILGKKRKGEQRRIGLARSLAIEKRKKTLLKEYEQSGKSSLFVDKRIGEQNDEIEEFDKAILRLQREHRSKLNKKAKYNLSDGEEDDFASLIKKDDFEDELSSDDKEEEEAEIEDKSSSFRDIIVNNSRLSEVDSHEGLENKQKSKKEVMQEIILKSKIFKGQKARDKEEDAHLMEQLDKDFSSLAQSEALLSLTQPSKMNALKALLNRSGKNVSVNEASGFASKDSDKKEQPDAYDCLVKEMALEMRARPSDRTKTPEEIAQEERERLEQLEEERQKRMREDDNSGEGSDGDEELDRAHPKRGFASGDDLGDSFSFQEEQQSMTGWVDEIFQRQDHDSEEESTSSSENSGDGESSEDDKNQEEESHDEESDQEEDYEDGPDDVSLPEKALSVKDWEQSDEDELSTDFEGEAETKEERSLEELDDTSISKAVKSKTVHQNAEKKKASVQLESLPFVIEAPQNLGEFLSLLENRSDADILEAINRIRASNGIRLAAENRKKMQVFYGVLLQYFAVLTNKRPLNLKLINLLVKPLIEMSVDTPYFAAICARHRIDHIRSQFCEDIKNSEKSSWPSLKTLLLLRLWAMTFPCSDFRHVVMTPAILLMCEYLMRCPLVSGKDTITGVFLCSMLLMITKQSRKFCPEAIMFLQMLLMSASGTQRSKLGQRFYLMDVRDPEPWLCIKGPVSNIRPLDFFSVMNMPDDSPFFSTDDFRVSVLFTVTETLREFINVYDELSSFPEIYRPIAAHLRELEQQGNLPELLQVGMRKLVQMIEEKVGERHMLRRPLQMRKEKPVPIKLLNPKFEDNFVKGRDYDPDRERAERKKLKKLLKQGAKGAARELRKDNAFLFEAKEKDRLALEAERAERYGKARAFLQEQEHAFKSGQLGKGRKRRR